MSELRRLKDCQVVVIWIDWYAYHVARFLGLNSEPSLAGRVVGLEMVSGVGVHSGLRFREELPAGLAVETLMPGVSWRDASKVQLARVLWQRLDALGPEVVLVPGYYTLPAIAAALWARLHGRRSVLMTETTAFDHRRRPLHELVKRTLLRVLFGWAVTGGKAHVRYLKQLRFPLARVVGSYDVVDNDAIREGVRRLRSANTELASSEPYFLFVGRLAEEKNVGGLLESWSRYREEGGRWRLVLAGDGPMRRELEEAADRSGRGAEVTFTGLKSLAELLPLYAAAGCFVLPSTREPWGLVVNEAMAAGLPVLVSRRCGCREDLVREGENGYSFDPEEKAELTRLLHTTEQLTPAQRASMGQRSEEVIAGYTPAGFGRAIARVLPGARHPETVALTPESAQ